MAEFLVPTIEMDVPAWQFYVFVSLGVVVVGIAKGGFGGGIGILAVPLLALAMPTGKMLGMLLPILIVADILSNLHYLREWDWGVLRWLLPGMIGGVLAGSTVLLALQQMPPKSFGVVMSLMVGGICLAVIVMQVVRLLGWELPTLPRHPASSVTVGVAAGATSTLNHSAGPIIAIYLLQYGLAKRVLVSTMLLYFFLGNLTKVPTYVYLGFITGDTLRSSLIFLPLLPIGTISGAWMNKHIPEKPFAAVMYVGAAAAAVAMIHKALS